MDTVTRIQIEDKAVYISHRESYESNYSPSSYGWIATQTELFNLG